MKPNPQQALVVEHYEGPCLVMAVPGSGKTASVTERTKRLVERGVPPAQILNITFTNKAAGEMRSRIAKAVGDVAAKMTLSTFHSFCSRIIRHNCDLLGLTKSYTIYDTDDQERLLKACIRKIEDRGSDKAIFKPNKLYIQTLMSFIEGKRNACLSDEVAIQKFQLTGNQFNVVQEYFNQLRVSNAVDFTGLLSETIRLFNEHPDVRDKYRQRFRFISVDEVQDTNVAQYELIKHLGLGHKNVLVVGDLDQSIYKFRNANPENILQFEKDFPGCKILKLEKNYRSTPSILKYSQTLIEKNTLRKGTTLMTDNPDGAAPQILAGITDLEMAALIATDVKKKIDSGTRPCEIAVLYRTNYASRVLENAMRNLQIKYKIIGGLSFWDRKEAKTGLAILKLMANANDRMSFEKVCEESCRGVGDKALNAIAELSRTNNISIMAAGRQYANNGSSSGKCLAPFIHAMDASHSVLPGQGMINVAQATLLWKRLEEDSSDTNDRCQNLFEVAREVDDYCSDPKAKNTLAGWLQNNSLLTDADEEDDDEAKRVKLMTLHGCKGLEFDCVYISHCNEGIIPHARVFEEAENDEELKHAIEEERRLLYVGMTRARKNLGLYFAVHKIDARSRAPKPCLPSPFLPETGISSPDLNKYRFGPDPNAPCSNPNDSSL